MYSTRGVLVAEVVEVEFKLGEFYLHLLKLPYIHKSHSEHFYGTEIEIWAGFGLVDNTEENEPIMSNFSGSFNMFSWAIFFSIFS